MTVEQQIAENAAEVKERRIARRSGIRLTVIKDLAIGIQGLLDMDTIITGRDVPVERVNVLYNNNRTGKIWLQVENKEGVYAENSLYSNEVAEKMRYLNCITINEEESRYLQEILRKHWQVLKIEGGFAVQDSCN